jgi:hypothetical protein
MQPQKTPQARLTRSANAYVVERALERAEDDEDEIEDEFDKEKILKGEK